MNPIAKVLGRSSRLVADLTAARGRPVDVAALGVTDRQGELPLGPAGGLASPNGACRMFRAADGWMAVNLARDEDHDLIPAWLCCEAGGAPWELIDAHGPSRRCDELVAQAILLGLPACRVGEMAWGDPEPLLILNRDWAYGVGRAAPKVVDLSALWAGPLCGAILAAAGCEVTKVESTRRPDPTRSATPAFYSRLNGGKAELSLDLTDAGDRARLLALVLEADVVITSARPRGLRSIGLDPEAILRARPLTWVAITAYGLSGAAWRDHPSTTPTAYGLSGAAWSDHPSTTRVGFGDDTAAAGGLVGWTADGEPRFLGDALADPLTGVAAAASALRALDGGRATVVDAGMAPIAWRAAQAGNARGRA